MKRALNFVVMALMALLLVQAVSGMFRFGYTWKDVVVAHVYLVAIALALVWELHGRAREPASATGVPAVARPARRPTSRTAGTVPVAVAQADPDAEAQRPLVSLVLLLAGPASVDDTDLRRRLSESFGAPFGDRPEDSHIFARFNATTLGLQVGDQRFSVVNSSDPYVKDRDAEARGAATAGLAEAIRRHTGWRAVDLIEDGPAIDKAAAYRTIGRAVVELAAGVEVLALFRPETGDMTPWRPDVAIALRAYDPLNAFAPAR